MCFWEFVTSIVEIEPKQTFQLSTLSPKTWYTKTIVCLFSLISSRLTSAVYKNQWYFLFSFSTEPKKKWLKSNKLISQTAAVNLNTIFEVIKIQTKKQLYVYCLTVSGWGGEEKINLYTRVTLCINNIDNKEFYYWWPCCKVIFTLDVINAGFVFFFFINKFNKMILYFPFDGIP